MKAHDRRRQPRRDFQTEPLEARSLLTGLAHPAAAAVPHALGHAQAHAYVQAPTQARHAPSALGHHTSGGHHRTYVHDHIVAPNVFLNRGHGHKQGHGHSGNHAESVAPSHVTITARITGLVQQPWSLPGQRVIASPIGAGQGHQFGVVDFAGSFYVQQEDQYTGAATILSGTGQLTSDALGVLQLAYNGAEQASPSGGGRIQWVGVAGASGGAYDGWVGTFKADGPLNLANDSFSLYFTIHLAPPRPAVSVVSTTVTDATTTSPGATTTTYPTTT